MRFLQSLLVEDGATTAVEYAVLLSLILMSLIMAIGAVGSESGGMWSGNREALDAVGFGQ